ncbi:efflux RND transporter periplasmic adaptor subunit [Piscinibacter sakaiensis]|uniref:Putative Co/Zn/Cd efflux system membrane fusion protein n=1 Tax=Piscinibacter sakaiensis TaxID=1547922 RepID=A0A0K8NX34_PISS1|nr:efflux RND transporter periplasmic adaptor subunit [Piscinibacter sakaiensis]GAP34941.1 putative Co/Zn/Cd efflux system membrane fusion protein [Piscinibacter sakaiensis]
MRRRGWIALGLGLPLAGWLGWRAVAARRAASGTAGPGAPGAATAASAAVPTLRLGPQDVMRAARTELTRTLDVSGGLKAVRSAVVKAKVAGELLRLDVREGDSVRAGQLLGEIDPADNRSRLKQAEETAAAARAQLDVAERTLANNQALVDQNFISRTALDTSIANANAARANLRAAEAAVELARKALDDARLVAPIGGTVSQRLMQPGERAPLDARIVEIVDLSALELEAAVPPEDIVALRVGQDATVEIDGLAQPLAARVARINPSTQAGTRAVLAYLALPPTPGLRQGLFARARVALGRDSLLAVPVALVRVDAASPTLMVLAGERIEARSVTLGRRGEARFGDRTEDAVEVLGGIAEGELLLRPVAGPVRAGTPARLASAP